MSDNAKSQADAQMESIHEFVDALNVDYDRLEELKDEANENKYFSAWGLIGCLPDSHMTFEDLEDARQALVDELNERADAMDDEANGMDAADVPSLLDMARRYRKDAQHIDDGKNSVVVNGYHFFCGGSENSGLDPDDWDELQELIDNADDCEDIDDARQAIMEDALGVEVKSDWHIPGGDSEPLEFRIVLCTGGPHVEIRGELDYYFEPSRAWLVYSDWFEGMTERVNDQGDMDALLAYANQFVFND